MDTLQNPKIKNKIPQKSHKIAIIFNIDKQDSNNNNAIYLFVNNFVIMESK